MTFLRNVFVAACCVILSSPAWSAACANTVGKKECNGSYFVCNTDADCKDVKKLPSNATAGHCVSAGRNGYKVCTATKCNDNYDVKGGRCVKKSKNATSTPPAQVQEIIERDYSATCKLKFSSGKEIEKVNQAGDDNSSLKMVWYTSVGADDLMSSDTNSNVYDPATPSLRDLVAIDGKNITDQEKQYLQKQGVYDIDFDCTGNGTYVLVARYNAWPDVRDEIIPEGGNILVKDGTECSLTFAKGQTLSGVHYANSRVLHGELFVSKTGKNMSIDYDHDNVGQMSSNYYGPGDDNNCIINNDASWVLGNHCYDAGNVPNMQDLVAVNGKNLDATNIEKLKKADEISFYCDPESKEGYVFYLQTVQETSGDDENGVLNSGDETDTPAEDKPADAASGDNNNPADNSQDDGTDDDTETVTSPDNAEAIADAESAYADAKANEQSTANKMLGGMTMAATGIGGMELAMGLAEKNADAAAEQDMAAYLATFTCRIGDKGGKLYKGGEMGIEVSGGNQLAPLYQQYVDLAADLKERKAALGMAPGIESAVVMDKANMGLYDDTGRGIENGTYASLYRASKGNENDAKKLADAKESSANRVKAGAIAAGAGVVGGIVGNMLINGDKGKVTEADCKKAGGTLKDDKCDCPGKRIYKDGKCQDISIESAVANAVSSSNATPEPNNDSATDTTATDVAVGGNADGSVSEDKIKECVNYINENATVVGPFKNHKYERLVVKVNDSLWLALNNEEAAALSPVWNWGDSEDDKNKKLYIDGTQEYEKDACTTVENMKAFIANAKKSCDEYQDYELQNIVWLDRDVCVPKSWGPDALNDDTGDEAAPVGEEPATSIESQRVKGGACLEQDLPNNATKGHYITTGRNNLDCKDGIKCSCAAQECKTGFTIKKVAGRSQGYCVKK